MRALWTALNHNDYSQHAHSAAQHKTILIHWNICIANWHMATYRKLSSHSRFQYFFRIVLFDIVFFSDYICARMDSINAACTSNNWFSARFVIWPINYMLCDFFLSLDDFIIALFLLNAHTAYVRYDSP